MAHPSPTNPRRLQLLYSSIYEIEHEEYTSGILERNQDADNSSKGKRERAFEYHDKETFKTNKKSR